MGDAPPVGTDPGSLEREPYDVIDRARTRQPDAWRDEAEKDPSRGTRAPVLAEMLRERVAHVGEQGHVISPWSFTSDDDLGGPPVEVLELERHDLAGAQPEPREQEHDGVVATAPRRRPVRGGERTLDVVGRQHHRHAGLLVRADPRDGPGEIPCDHTPEDQEAQERPQPDAQQAGRLQRPSGNARDKKRPDGLRVERLQRALPPGPHAVREERPRAQAVDAMEFSASPRSVRRWAM